MLPRCFLMLALLAPATVLASKYLSGLTNTYSAGDRLSIFVAKLTSVHTQYPLDYYSLPFCPPTKKQMERENLGQLVAGERMENTIYSLSMKEEQECSVGCAVRLKKEGKASLIKAIDEDYRVHLVLDGLPVGYVSEDIFRQKTFSRGFPVGFVSDGRHYVNNHLQIIVKYHDEAEKPASSKAGKVAAAAAATGSLPEQAVIVGFEVVPKSIKHSFDGTGEYVAGQTVLNTCKAGVQRDYQSIDRSDTVIFTYDVTYERTDVEFANRWDSYLSVSSPNEQVHWWSITQSLLVCLMLTIMIALVLIRALKKDIAQYNDPAALEEAKEESGWKLVHGDVFRAPNHALIFSVLIGTGIQLLCMSATLLGFALLGFLSPSNRGSLGTAFILLFVFLGSVAGYFSSTTYKMFKGTEWKNCFLLTAFFYPSIIFAVFFVLNLALWMEGSSGALQFSTYFSLLFLWFFVSVPLVIVGSFYGFKRETTSFPVRTATLEREVPQQRWYLNPLLTGLLGGILPFGVVSVELYFIMSSLWLHQIYHIIGFLLLVGVLLVATCAEISILLCYVQLCHEDYRWWWRSFFNSGACAGYLFLYSVWYNLTELSLDGAVAEMLYYSYMGLIAFTFFLVTGTIGTLSCFIFNLQIYASIKVD